MTNNQLTDERVTSVIERLEHYACNLKWTNVRGAQDLLAAADGLRELQERRKAAMDSEPVAYISKSDFDAGYPHILARRDFNKACTVPVYAAQPAPEYPEVLPCPVLLVPGMRFGKGVKTRLVLEAIQRRAEHHAELEAMAPEERAEYDAGIEAFKAMLPQPAPVVQCPYPCGWDNLNKLAIQDAALVARGLVEGEPATEAQRQAAISNNDRLLKVISACRAAMLHGGNSPVIPDGYVMVPMRLTAENGAKGALSGEFSETKFVNCPECFGDDECETCDGSGKIEITVPVTWTTIKAIWVKGVEHFAVTAQEND